MGLVGLAAAIAGALSLLPQLAISPEDPRGSKNPLSVPFTLTNESMVPVRNVLFDCTFHNVVGRVAFGADAELRDTTIEGLTLSYAHDTVAYLVRPDRTIMPCGYRDGEPWVLMEAVTWARMTIAVHYTPFLLPNWEVFRRRKAVGFVTFRDRDSTYRWFPTEPGP